MKNELETTIQNAQKITLGQVDNGMLATAVTCAESLAITRHGRVESYLVPKHVIDEMLLKNAVLECDNNRLLGEKVAESITVPKLSKSARSEMIKMMEGSTRNLSNLPKNQFFAGPSFSEMLERQWIRDWLKMSDAMTPQTYNSMMAGNRRFGLARTS